MDTGKKAGENPPLPGRLSTASWVTYDLAKTGYHAIAVTLFLPIFIPKATGYLTPFTVTTDISLIIGALLAPIVGAFIDAGNRTKAVTLAATALCVAAISSIPLARVTSVHMILVLYGVSMVMYLVAMVSYDALLAVVATPKRRGLVSGLGIGIGYGGTVLALGAASHFFPDEAASGTWPLALAGGFFAVFALPLALLVPERRVAAPQALSASKAAGELGSLWRMLKLLPKRPELFWFFLGNFFFVDAVNTVRQVVAPFLENAFGMEKQGYVTLLIIFALMAIPAGLFQGWLADRIGAKRTMLLSTLFFSMAIAAGALVPTSHGMVFFIILCTAGTLGLAGAWTAGRKWVLDLVPPAEAGAWFGLYGFTVKASIISSVLYSLSVDTLRTTLWAGAPDAAERAYRWSTVILLALTAAGAFCLAKAGRKAKTP
jgi:MFS transporter, UMF1 family